MNTPQKKPQVPAARNTLQILALLSSIDVPISAARIRRELGLPRSTTYHLLGELVDSGFAVHLPEHRTYGLGLAAYEMASAYATQQPLVRAATSLLERVAALTGGSGHLSRMAGSEVLYLQEIRSQGAHSLVTEVGVRLQAHKTASGRIMLAYLPDPEARAAFATSGTTESLREFRVYLELCRKRGWAEEEGVVSRGQSSIAVPVFDHVARPAAALAVTFPSGTVDEARHDRVLDLLKSGATQLQRKMYGE